MALAVSAGSGGIPSASAAVTTTSTSPVSKALDYLVSCQRPDGGFAEKGATASDDKLTAWTIIALSSAGQDPNAWKVSGHSPVEFLRSQSAKWSSVTDWSRTTLAVLASGEDPRSFGGVNLVAKIVDERNDHGAAGDSFGPDINTHVWALIALQATGEETGRGVSWLLSEQNQDSGWGSAPDVASSDPINTAIALQALIACGQNNASLGVTRGIAYLDWAQKTDAGFGEANSTAWAIQALNAAGVSPSDSAWKKGSATPVSTLNSLVRTDGSIGYAASKNPLLTMVQAIPALSSKPFPVALRGWRAGAAFRGAPVVSLVTPAVAASKSTVVRLSLSDAGTGINTGTLKVEVDGKSAEAKLSGSSVSVGPVSVSKGSHRITVSVADHAGNAIDKQEFKFQASTTAVSASAVSAGTAATFPSQPTTRTGTFKFPGPKSNDPVLSSSTTKEPEATRTIRASKRPAEPEKKPSPIIPLAIGATTALAVVTSGTWMFVRRRKKPSPAE